MFHLSLRWSGHVSSSPWSNASKVTSLYNCSLGPKVFSQFLCLCIRNDDENGSIVRLLMIVARTWRRSNTFTRTLHFAAFPAFFSTDPLYEITISMWSKIFSKQMYISTLRTRLWHPAPPAGCIRVVFKSLTKLFPKGPEFAKTKWHKLKLSSIKLGFHHHLCHHHHHHHHCYHLYNHHHAASKWISTILLQKRDVRKNKSLKKLHGKNFGMSHKTWLGFLDS